MKLKSKNLIVIASYGEEYIKNFLATGGNKHPTLVVKTDLMEASYDIAECLTCPFMGYDTGAYLWTYWNFRADKYLFCQDSLIPHNHDYADAFFEGLDEYDVIAWTGFPFNIWDSERQLEACKYNMSSTDFPALGIFGPIFAASRRAMDALRDNRLLPPFPMTKEQQQGKEREWAQAFHLAKMRVGFIEPTHSPYAMKNGLVPCFTKLFPKRS